MLRVRLRVGSLVDRGGVVLAELGGFFVGVGDIAMLSSLLLSKTSSAATSHVGTGGAFGFDVALTGSGEGSDVVSDGGVVVIRGVGGKSGLSVLTAHSALSSLLLSKTAAFASVHVGIGGSLIVGVGGDGSVATGSEVGVSVVISGLTV